MAQFKALNPKIEVNGETVLSVVGGVGPYKDSALAILAACGIQNPTPGQWYSQQAWLDAFQKIASETGASTLFMIGKSIPEHASFPPAINTLEAALASIDVAYHMNHRLDGQTLFNPLTGQMREGIGHYAYEKVSDRRHLVVCENPYPCDFDRGIVEAMAKRFKPAKVTLLQARHDDTRPCRKKGADSCTYVVSW